MPQLYKPHFPGVLIKLGLTDHSLVGLKAAIATN